MYFEIVSLGDILTIERRKVVVEPDKQYPEVGVYCFGRGLFYKEPRSGLEVGNKPLFKIKANDFILQTTFAWEGAVARVSEKDEAFYGSVRVLTFRVDENKCLPDFLVHYFKTPEGVEQLGRISPGSAGRNRVLSVKRIHEVMVPLPTLSEQREIVAKIESLVSKTEDAKNINRQSSILIDSFILQIAQELLTPRDGWKVGKIGDFASMSTGTTPPSLRAEYFDGPIIWYTPGDLSFTKELGTSTRTLTEHAVADGKARLFGPDSVLLVSIGGSLGKVGIARDSCSANQQITGVMFTAEVDPEYGYWWLRSKYKRLRDAARKATLPILNQKRLSSIEFAFPPLNEQQSIVSALDNYQTRVNKMKSLQSKIATEIDAMLPSILDKAFRGEL